jgi:hypothetical protein
MSFTPKTPKDDHFVSNPDLALLNHRPHKAAALLYNALTATAVFTIWPHLLFFGGWSAMVCCVNKYTAAELAVPNTLLTALGKSIQIDSLNVKAFTDVRCTSWSHSQL